MRFSSTLLFIGLSVFTFALEALACPAPWESSKGADCELMSTSAHLLFFRDPVADLRIGFQREKAGVTFRGNILYFEGLADSMVNHQPLFSRLTEAGYRVIAFDYMGQGGSTGDMSNTRIRTIAKWGDEVYKKLARDQGSAKKIILGWSTGGLAGYYVAHKGGADAVVLISPGLAPKPIVGEGFSRITLASLTSQSYQGHGEDPHIDPIKPETPLAVWPFATNLLAVAKESWLWNVPRNVKGLVLFGSDDAFVFVTPAKLSLGVHASHFEVLEYEGGRHELDNEVKSISALVHADILAFLNQL